jgi:hypothetical protein
MTSMVMMNLFLLSVRRGVGTSISVATYQSTVPELFSYHDSGTETQFGYDFNVLTWWKSHN